ncbi:MAG: signal peptidase II [Ruthenibacterium sp.]
MNIKLCRKRFFVLMTVFMIAALVALDQLTKYLATVYLAPVGTMPFIPGVLELRFILNDGAAFSILAGNRWFLIIFTGIALTALAIFLLWKKPKNRLAYFSLVLILAGGLGNLIDRILNGAVVDFFATTFMNFAVFNVADCFVCVGVAMLLIYVIADELKTSKANQQKKTHDDT